MFAKATILTKPLKLEDTNENKLGVLIGDSKKICLSLLIHSTRLFPKHDSATLSAQSRNTCPRQCPLEYF